MTIIDSILDKAKSKADAAEVFHMKSETTACAWNADRLKLAEAKETLGVALRVLIDGKVGFFATSKVSDPDKIVDTACELAPLGSEFAGEFPNAYKPADSDFFHEPTAAVGADRLIEAGNGMIAKAKEAKSEAIFEAKLDRAIIEITIANSLGARAQFRKTHFDGYLWGSITKEGDILNLYEFDETNQMDDQPDEWAEVVSRKLADAATIVTLPAGEYPCILTPKAAAIMGPIRNALSARSVLKDLSPFKDKVGERIFDPRVSLVDDGLHGEMPGSQPVDDEGVTGQRTALVDAGILRGFIHDLHTAKKMGAQPTGNGMRMGLSTAPRAGFTTLSLTPGEKSLDEMIKGIDKGVIVDQIMGAHQASPFSGDFSVNVDLGFVVENGRIVGRFKDGMLAGNVFKMLRDQLVEIGSEPKYTGYLIPPLLFDGMTIATGG